MQDAKTLAAAEIVSFEISADGEKVGAPHTELVQWRMRPWNAGLFHGGESDRLAEKCKGARA